MSVRNLQSLFAPRSVAVIGASNRERSVGAVVTRNLLRGGFRGPVMPVNPKHQAVAGVLAYPDVASLPITPDLAVIATPPAPIPGLREMAFIAHAPGAEGETLGVVRAIADPDNREAEFAIVVRSDLKGLGLGRALLEKLIRYCRQRGTGQLVGQVLPANRPMRLLAQETGFQERYDPDAEVVEVRLRLQPR